MRLTIAISALLTMSVSLIAADPGPKPSFPYPIVDLPVVNFTSPLGQSIDEYLQEYARAKAVRVRNSAIARVMTTEGDYADHRRDPGGPTRYGITKATARHHGYHGAMANMPRDVATMIYESLWVESGAPTYSDPELATQVFDAYVQHGPKSKNWVISGIDNVSACQYLNSRRMEAYRASKNWKVFKGGWTARVDANLQHCESIGV